MDISEQLLPPSATAPRRASSGWAVVLQVMGTIAFVASVPVGLGLLALAGLNGTCSGSNRNPRLVAEARLARFQIGLVWCLLPFAVAALARLLHTHWVTWVVLGCLVGTGSVALAVMTDSVEPFICF